jgi:UDP-N-acetylglucosamine transferase subunit ALG13
MIFVTVGSSWTPFDRLLAGLDRVPIDEPMIVQHGPSTIRPAGALCVDFLPYDRLVEHVAAARAVVTHAGVGSVVVALLAAKVPIVVPRLRRFVEAVDDHQVAFARLLASRGLVRLVEDTAGLPAAVAKAGSQASVEVGGLRLVQELHDYLAAAIGETPLPFEATPDGAPAEPTTTRPRLHG